MIATAADVESSRKPSDQADVHWLSQGAEKLVADTDHTPFDILIVGSGYGGAVAAARFAGTSDQRGAPLSVAVFERGREYIPGSFPSRFADLAGHVRFSSASGGGTRGRRFGLFDVRLSPDMSALVGNGLGGGSLINAGVMERPDESIFDSTEPGKKRRWPAAITNAELGHYFAKAEENLRPAKLPEDVPPPARLTALMELGKHSDGKANGSRKTDISVNFSETSDVLTPCVRCGNCFTGCNFGAKRSTDTNYLADAYRCGAQIYTGATVLYVQRANFPSSSGGQAVAPSLWQVFFTLTDSKVSCSDPGPFSVLAKRVILAAGTFGSTEILMRSSALGDRKRRANTGEGLALSPQLGKGFSGNGDMIAVAVNQPTEINAVEDEAAAADDRKSGPTITGMIDMRSDKDPERRFVIEEMAVPVALRRMFEETITSFGALYAFSEQDRSEHKKFKDDDVDPAAIDPSRVQHTAVYAMMGIDSADGQFEFPREAANALNDGWLVVRWPQVHRRQLGDDSLYQRQIDCLEELQKKSVARGQPVPQVIPYPLWRPLPKNMAAMVDSNSGPLLTVHPLGGCSMGKDVDSGVVDDLGRVFDAAPSTVTGVGRPPHDGLVVLDGSIVPCALGINPALTIAALAERSCEKLKAHWNLRDRTATAPLRHLRKRPTRLVAPPTSSGTAIQMAERMTGQVKLSNDSTHYLSLVLEFEEIPDLMEFMRDGKKEIKAISTKSFIRIHQNRSELNAHSISAPPAGGNGESCYVNGTLEYLQREPRKKWQRIDVGLAAFSRNRLLRDLWWMIVKRRNSPLLAALWSWLSEWRARVRQPSKVAGFARFLTHVGEARTLKYDLTLESTLDCGLRANGRLVGTKTIAYTKRGNPWRQLMEMSLDYYPPGSTKGIRLTRNEPLRIDLGYFAQREQPLLKVVRQTDAPTTWADLTSLGLYLSRIVGRIHLWSFRAPDERRAEWKQNLAARLPGFISWVPDPQVIELHNADHAGRERLIRLARYPARSLLGRPRERSQKNPVVLLHGFGASGGTFAHRLIRRNLVQLMTRRGYETWVVELRTSIGLLSSRQAYDFEQLAREDVVAAIDEVRHRAGSEKVDVVAHCVGAAMFCLAALSGGLQGKIGAAVLSQVGPVTVFHRDNVFRGYVSAYLRRFFGAKIFDVDVSPYRSTVQRVIDRLLSTFPYPDEEENYEQPLFRQRPHVAIRHRADAIFGQLYASKNVPLRVRERLDELIGHVHVDSMAQLMFYARHRQLTSADGLRSLLDRTAIRENFAFPVLFLFGADNRVFDKAGMSESVKLLRGQFEWKSKGRRPFQRRVFKDLGHQDGLIGPRLATDVFPAIDRFLRVKRPQPPLARADIKYEWAAPRFGPIIGWLRANPQDQASACVAIGPPVTFPAAQWWSHLQDAQVVDLAIGPRKMSVANQPQRGTFETSRDTSAIALMWVDALRFNNASAVSKLMKKMYKAAEVQEPFEVKELSKDVLAASDDSQREPQRLRFALGSCQYPAGIIDRDAADESFRRLNELLETDRAPQLLLLAGDQIYTDETAGLFDVASPIERYIRPYENFYTKAEVRKLLARLPVYCMLDDHEIADNWEPPLQTDQEGQAAQREALAAFEAYQWNMGPGPDFDHKALINRAASLPPAPNGRRRYWYHFFPAGFGTFMMDTRTERDRRTLRTLHQHTEQDAQRTKQLDTARIVSEEQFGALQSWLLQMKKRDERAPKFILSPSVVFPWYKDIEHDRLYAARCDGWDGFPASLQRLFRFIGEREIQNVVFLSGDYHLSCIAQATITVEGKQTVVHSVVSSGMYAPYPFANAKPDELALHGAGTWITDATLSCQVRTLPLKRSDGKRDLRTDDRAVTDNGFAVIEVAKQNGGWTLDVKFHTTTDVIYDPGGSIMLAPSERANVPVNADALIA